MYPTTRAPQPAPRKRHYLRWIFGILGGFVLLIIILSVAAPKSSNTPAAPQHTVTSAPAVPQTVAPAAVATQPPATPQTLLDFTGHGSESTPKFSTSGDFTVTWAVTGNVDTSSGTPIPDNFMVSMYTAGQGDDVLNFSPVNDIQVTDGGNQTVSGDDGSHYFTVKANPASTWTIKVVTAP